MFAETLETIQQRMNDDANAGLDPTSPGYIDTREGTFFADLRDSMALEFARLWDALGAEVPASAFVIYAWGEYLDAHAATWGIERKPANKASGGVNVGAIPDGTIIPVGTVFGVVPSDPEADAPTFVTTTTGLVNFGVAAVSIEATEPGTEFNVPAGAITDISQSGIPQIVSVINTLPITGGTDEESDEDLRGRVLAIFGGIGAGTANDYKRWALSRSGVERVSVFESTPSAGSVTVYIMKTNGDPIVNTVITTDVVNYIETQRPVGVAVVVSSPADDTVAVVGQVGFLAGYSLDGTGGTVPRRQAINDALNAYFAGLDVGEDVNFDRAKATMFVPGVAKTGTFTLDGGTANVVIAATAHGSMLNDAATLTEIP